MSGFQPYLAFPHFPQHSWNCIEKNYSPNLDSLQSNIFKWFRPFAFLFLVLTSKTDNCLTPFAQSPQKKEQQKSFSYICLFLSSFFHKIYLEKLELLAEIMKRRQITLLSILILIVTVSVLNKDCPLYSPKLRFQFGDYYSINEKVIGKIIFAYFQAGVFLTSYCQSVLLPIVVGHKAWSTQVLSRTGDPFSFPPFSFFHVLKLLWSFQRKNIDMATGC